MRRVCLALSGLVVTSTYVLCALVLAGPVTPIRFDVGFVAQALEPNFSQNWQLFAPDPISDERGVLARLRCGTATGAWTDITSGPIASVQTSRLFPSRESRIISNGLTERFGKDDVTKRLEANDMQALLNNDRSDKKRPERVMARYAGLTLPCPGPTPRPDAVQLRYIFHDLPTWSHRLDKNDGGATRSLDSEWIVL